jgi:hypothetical protein
VTDNQALELDRKRRHADKQGAYRTRLRRSGMATVSTALPADLLQYVTEQRDRTGHPNLGAMLAEIVREHRARNFNPQSKDSTVSA